MEYTKRALWGTTTVLFVAAGIALMVGLRQRTRDAFGLVYGGELYITIGVALLGFGLLSTLVTIAAGTVTDAINRQTLLLQQMMSQRVINPGVPETNPPQVPRSAYIYPQA